MNGRPTLEELVDVRRHFQLPDEALVEKDWHVVRALAAIAAADKGPFQLVFQGGTALSRAHRVIQRMSEDIDIKIVSNDKPPRPALRRLRQSIIDQLRNAGFDFDPANPEHLKSKYESRYTLYRLPYAPLVAGRGALRPEIQIETSVWPARRAPVELTVASFVADAFNRKPEVPAIACAAIVETAAEKFVALTRRAGSEFAGVHAKRDPTLVRHIYDLHVTREHYDSAEAAALAVQVMQADAESRGDEFPAYRDNPLAETLRTVDLIATDEGFATTYDEFRRDMVYGQAPEFSTAIDTLKVLAKNLPKSW